MISWVREDELESHNKANNVSLKYGGLEPLSLSNKSIIGGAYPSTGIDFEVSGVKMVTQKKPDAFRYHG